MNNSIIIKKKITQLRSRILQWKRFLIASSITLMALAALYFWFLSQQYVSTEDAYINGNIVQIASRVTGQVKHLYVDNNQLVEKGQILFELDRTPFEVAVEQAEAQYLIDKTNLQHALATSIRTKELVRNEVMSRQAGDDITAKLKSAKAALKLSEAKLKEAKLRLSYTHVVAPTSGLVSNLSLRVGNVVSENQPLFAMIDDATFWVDANFKETELEHIQKNQLATIKIDMYPHKQFTGIVSSISGGSGTAFSLMPPQNATGNWVKVTQRVPVRIQITKPDSQYPLRLGTSAKVTIDLQSKQQTQVVSKTS
ncbi:TPA: HlyD family secretion protein [Legionella pneumophila]|uniref:HlyD family secretion protein n=1 Tax=Legionella TaxID=445 RepID=UPI000EFE2F2F|nr:MULTISPECIES: HlyD family secretion protein [Legionella]MCK1847882.1 HlyD family secretion protein [Legionella pneumophila]RMX17722.1 HlyD family secretion protein [Legionella jordanis]HAT1880056.1 HlyD family secretion protein [Legionella pneumophila]HAU0182677.1 HlyD family secretion protein [Legionella pneumophila]HAU0785975.1 HlyD family secretion protein [Legionella pneumophila]